MHAFRQAIEARDFDAMDRLLAENASDVVIRRSAGNVRTYVSPACEEVFGYTLAAVRQWQRVIANPQNAQAKGGMSGSTRSTRSPRRTPLASSRLAIRRARSATSA